MLLTKRGLYSNLFFIKTLDARKHCVVSCQLSSKCNEVQMRSAKTYSMDRCKLKFLTFTITPFIRKKALPFMDCLISSTKNNIYPLKDASQYCLNKVYFNSHHNLSLYYCCELVRISFFFFSLKVTALHQQIILVPSRIFKNICNMKQLVLPQ